MRRDLRWGVPLEAETPLPADAPQEDEWRRDAGPKRITAFRGEHQTMLGELVYDSSTTRGKWGGSTPNGIRSADGEIKPASLSHLMWRYFFGGESWIRQLSLGSPIAGALSQEHAYMPDGGDSEILPRGDLGRSAPARFHERAAQPAHRGVQVLWGEAADQLTNGWLFPACFPYRKTEGHLTPPPAITTPISDSVYTGEDQSMR